MLLFLSFYVFHKCPVDVLERNYDSHDVSKRLRYSGLFHQIEISPEETWLFYFNSYGNLNCAVLEKKILGDDIAYYDIAYVIAGDMEINNKELRTQIRGSSHEEGRWIYYGVIYDDSVEKIVLNDMEANIVSKSDLQVFYAYWDEELVIGGYSIFDSEGNELDNYR